jgi:hypothetical protein
MRLVEIILFFNIISRGDNLLSWILSSASVRGPFDVVVGETLVKESMGISHYTLFPLVIFSSSLLVDSHDLRRVYDLRLAVRE